MWASVAFVLLILDNVLIAWCSMFFFALALFYVIFQTTDPASLSVMILGTVLVTSIISLPTWWGRDYGNFTEWLSDLRCRFWQRRSREQGSVWSYKCCVLCYEDSKHIWKLYFLVYMCINSCQFIKVVDITWVLALLGWVLLFKRKVSHIAKNSSQEEAELCNDLHSVRTVVMIPHPQAPFLSWEYKIIMNNIATWHYDTSLSQQIMVLHLLSHCGWTGHGIRY